MSGVVLLLQQEYGLLVDAVLNIGMHSRATAKSEGRINAMSTDFTMFAGAQQISLNSRAKSRGVERLPLVAGHTQHTPR